MARETRNRNSSDGTESQLDEPITEDPCPRADDGLVGAVDSNTQLLEQLLDQVADLRHVVDKARCGNVVTDTDPASDDECEQLSLRIQELEVQVSELEQQNSDLATQLASANVQHAVATSESSTKDALSWEERKLVILQQMEEDSFDAEEFVASMAAERDNESESPVDYVHHLHSELENRDAEIARRDDELKELQFLLEQQSETCESGVAIGAAAIAGMVDSDELIQQERERLQLLQAEWEEKFRQGEIEASLERAKLARERLALAQKQTELEEQLDHLRRETRSQKRSGNSTRKWLAELGLTDEAT